jgi:hypothetical protein
VFNKVDDTAGYKVATWGGSYDTARLVGSNGGLNWQVERVNKMDEAFAALDNGRVQAVLAVAGAPAENFEALPANKYKLIPFSDMLTQKLVAIYSGGAILNYSNLGEGIKSISTNAVLFTREFSDPEMLRALAELRACAYKSIPILKDRRGSHKKWRQVSVTNKGKWPYYDLPGVATPTSNKK